MSATSAIYSTALETITQWACLLVPKNQQKQWVPVLAEVTVYWYFTSSKPTQQQLIRSLTYSGHVSIDNESFAHAHTLKKSGTNAATNTQCPPNSC